MAIEKFWPNAPVQVLTQDGGQYGLITIPSTDLFKVKQKVVLFANGVTPLDLEVKRVTSSKTLELGPVGPSMSERSDVRLYTTAANAGIFAKEQSRPAIPTDQVWRAVYEEEPAVALRTTLVDRLGQKYSTTNPLPVQLADGSLNIGSIEANLEVQLTAKDGDPENGRIHDSIRIGDGVEEVAVNPDGSLNVVVVQGGKIPKPTQNIFNEVSAVNPNELTTVVTYTVLPGKKAILDRVVASGENLAKYSIVLNNQIIDVKRTYWTGGFNVEFDFQSQGDGMVLNSGDVLELKVLHTSDPADFDARIQLVELD